MAQSRNKKSEEEKLLKEIEALKGDDAEIDKKLNQIMYQLHKSITGKSRLNREKEKAMMLGIRDLLRKIVVRQRIKDYKENGEVKALWALAEQISDRYEGKPRQQGAEVVDDVMGGIVYFPAEKEVYISDVGETQENSMETE